MPGRKRANGPYKHGRVWRVVLTPAPTDGSGRYRVYDTEREARSFVNEFNRQTQNITCGQAVSEYLLHLARYGGPRKNEPLRQSSLDSIRHRLTAMLQLQEGDRPLSAVTPNEARKLYQARVVNAAVDTQRGELVVAQVFARWCIDEKGWLSVNPWDGIKPQGERTKGKPQLTIDESRRYLAMCLEENSAESVAAAALLLLGVRISELTDRIVRDLNRDPCVLSIPKAKTRAGVRVLAVPNVLSAPLVRLCEGKAGHERIFSFSRYALYHHVLRLCRAAGVPEVCPHGLRGSASTNELVSGTALADVAARRGHANTTVTREHYLVPGTEESIAAAAKARLLIRADDGNKLEMGQVIPFPQNKPEGETGWN